MMVIHACSYFLKSKGVFLIWNYLQWAVPVFLFCSFYLSLKSDKKIDFGKRLKRLFIPYWIFLFIYFILLFIFEKKNFSFQYLTANIFLYKGLDFNWLVLLFFYFTFLIPFFKWLAKSKVFFYTFFGVALSSSIFFIFSKPIPYRFIMWLPWSTYLYFTYFMIINEKNRLKTNLLVIVSFTVFLGLFFLEKNLGRNTSQFANKYPPTLLHLSFGMFSTIITYRMSKAGLFDLKWLRRILDFFSINSYSLYFIHILVMFVFGWTGIVWKLNWFSFFILIAGLSSGILLLWKSSRSAFGRLMSRS